MRKIFSVILTVCLILNVFSFAGITASAAESGVVGSCIWQLNGTELIITGNGDMGYSTSWPWGQNITKLTIAEGVTSIGMGAFEDCTSLKNATLPNSLKTIDKFAFYGCIELLEITIPNSVTSIGRLAFSNCEKITEVNIPASVANLEKGVFDNCYSLKEITVDEANLDYLSIDGVLFNKNKTTLIKYPNSRMQLSYSIPDSVTRIEHNAFMDAWYLKNISIPDTVTYIGINAFFGTPYYNNKSNYVDGILYLGKHILVADCTLSSFAIRRDTKTIADGAFTACENIKEIVIPDGVVTIGGNTFAWCSSLEKVYIPKSVKTIGESAFYDCSQLKNIYYSGSMADRNEICVHRYNSELDNINWNYEKYITNGWFQDGSIWEFYENYNKAVGWKFIDGNWYYFNADGAMCTGWQYIGAWYYFNASGAMQTGWVKDCGIWYYLNADGAMATGWKQIGGTWYYFDASGAMQIGWVKDCGVWYYLNTNGAMATGWQQIGGTWYYFYSNGTMAANRWIDGYWLNAMGAWA